MISLSLVMSLVGAVAVLALKLSSLPLWLQLGLGLVVVVVLEGRSREGQTLANLSWAGRLLKVAPVLAVVCLLLLSSHPVAYGLWTLSYVGVSYLQRAKLAVLQQQLLRGGINQFLAIWAIFLAGAFWQWPSLVIIALSWVASFGIIYRLLEEIGERASKAIAAAWALVVAELAWIFSIWLVSYPLAGGVIVVPQAAIVVTALGYCFGGIYFAHRQSSLSGARLMEYLLIGLSLLVIVIAGTKWTGTIN